MVSFLVGAALAKPMAKRGMIVHEQRGEVPNGFAQTGVPSSDTLITLRIALSHTNIAGLESELYAVSDPVSARYGQHLTPAEVGSYVLPPIFHVNLLQVAEFVKPTEQAVTAVDEWLSENDISSTPVAPAGDMISITISVEKANKLLDTRFNTFTHMETGAKSIRTLAYSIPVSLQGVVEFVHPTVSFTRPLAKRPAFTAIKANKAPNSNAASVSDAVPASCASTITPSCLQVSAFQVIYSSGQLSTGFVQALYGIPTTRATQSSNTLGVSGFTDQFANQADLKVRSWP